MDAPGEARASNLRYIKSEKTAVKILLSIFAAT